MMADEIFKYLRPARLEDPSTKQYKHWKKTLENFLIKIKTTDDNDKLLILTTGTYTTKISENFKFTLHQKYTENCTFERCSWLIFVKYLLQKSF